MRHLLHVIIALYLPLAVSSSASLETTDLKCDRSGVCCEFHESQPWFQMLPQRIRQALLISSAPAFSIIPNVRIGSFASGGKDLFNLQLYFSKRIDSRDIEATMEMHLANDSRDGNIKIESPCRLNCKGGSNVLVCDVPDITKVVRNNYTMKYTHQRLLALPLNGLGYCHSSEFPVSLCYDIKLNGESISFFMSEVQRPDLPYLLQDIASPETIGNVVKSIKPIHLDQAIIYLPNPEVTGAKFINGNVTLIKGYGLQKETDAGFSAVLSIAHILGKVNCQRILNFDENFIVDSLPWLNDNETIMACDFEKSQFQTLLERSRPMAINESSVMVTVTVEAGFWSGSVEVLHCCLPPPDELNYKIIPAIVVPIAMVVLAILLGILLICFILYSAKTGKNGKKIKSLTMSWCHHEEGSGNTKHNMGTMFSPEIQLVIENKTLPAESIIVGEKIGTGHFGIVTKGTMVAPGKRSSKEIAIKFIQNCSDRTQLQEFFEEAIHMFAFDHPNVLSAIGLLEVQSTNAPAIVVPLMDLGDLRKFVQKHGAIINEMLLMDFAQQIAEGMAYLSSRSFIHRDLAARNCLLNSHRRIKIADFGLSRLATDKDYDYVPTYPIQIAKRPLPIRWMAPECIESGIFSEKTDVWSYGILLWELTSRGQRPYAEKTTPGEVIHFVCVDDRRLPQSDLISDTFYAIMVRCWSSKPSDRPTFIDLVLKTRQLLNDPTSPLLVSMKSVNCQYSTINQAEKEVYEHFQKIRKSLGDDRPDSGESEQTNSTTAPHQPIPKFTSTKHMAHSGPLFFMPESSTAF